MSFPTLRSLCVLSGRARKGRERDGQSQRETAREKRETAKETQTCQSTAHLYTRIDIHISAASTHARAQAYIDIIRSYMYVHIYHSYMYVHIYYIHSYMYVHIYQLQAHMSEHRLKAYSSAQTTRKQTHTETHLGLPIARWSLLL